MKSSQFQGPEYTLDIVDGSHYEDTYKKRPHFAETAMLPKVSRRCGQMHFDGLCSKFIEPNTTPSNTPRTQNQAQRSSKKTLVKPCLVLIWLWGVWLGVVLDSI